MNRLLIQRIIVSIIIAIFIMSGLTGGTSVQNENKFYVIDSQFDEFKKDILIISGNQPPETPDINGPTTGKPGDELTYIIVSTDPEENDIVYCYDWGDDSGQVCIGPFPSGDEVTISHVWKDNGTYTISVKAADILGAESGLATLKVKITTSRILIHSKIIILKIISWLEKIKREILEFYR